MLYTDGQKLAPCYRWSKHTLYAHAHKHTLSIFIILIVLMHVIVQMIESVTELHSAVGVEEAVLVN